MTLTKRHIEVLKMVANGRKVEEIGVDLAISSRTVESHIILIKAKIGAKTLPHMVHLAHQQKLIK